MLTKRFHIEYSQRNFLRALAFCRIPRRFQAKDHVDMRDTAQRLQVCAAAHKCAKEAHAVATCQTQAEIASFHAAGPAVNKPQSFQFKGRFGVGRAEWAKLTYLTVGLIIDLLWPRENEINRWRTGG